MSVRLLVGEYDGTREACVLVDSVTGLAFGPLFKDDVEAEAFLGALRREGIDARELKDPARTVQHWREGCGIMADGLERGRRR